jgi:hypothetical protein
MCETVSKPLLPISAARSGRSTKNSSAAARLSAVDAVFHEIRGFAGVGTRDHRFSRVERFDHDEPVVFLHGHEGHGQRARIQVDQLLVADAPEKLNPAIAGGQRPELRLVFSGARDLERDIARQTLHRANDEIGALPPVEAAGQEEVLAGSRRFEPADGCRRMQHLVGDLVPERVSVD